MLGEARLPTLGMPTLSFAPGVQRILGCLFTVTPLCSVGQVRQPVEEGVGAGSLQRGRGLLA